MLKGVIHDDRVEILVCKGQIGGICRQEAGVRIHSLASREKLGACAIVGNRIYAPYLGRAEGGVVAGLAPFPGTDVEYLSTREHVLWGCMIEEESDGPGSLGKLPLGIARCPICLQVKRVLRQGKETV